ncbi:MAG: hypothetical protein MZV70_18700 [Desulfobacterales bacterium]|nr:hypothetical protein [Desulfobacterales bacterium]
MRATHALDGLSLAAHVDRPANGIINQLGFIPPGPGPRRASRCPTESRRPRRASALPAIGDRALPDLFRCPPPGRTSAGPAPCCAWPDADLRGEPACALTRRASTEPRMAFVTSDMRELSLHILDIVENGITAGADRIAIRVEESSADGPPDHLAWKTTAAACRRKRSGTSTTPSSPPARPAGWAWGFPCWPPRPGAATGTSGRDAAAGKGPGSRRPSAAATSTAPRWATWPRPWKC